MIKILAIETSCDETGAAVLESQNKSIVVLSNITSTSLPLHAATGGIIPESAARMQVEYIIPVVIRSLLESKGIKTSQKDKLTVQDWKKAKEILKNDIDQIAVTYGPGLIGSLLVGVETAKTLAFTFNKPLIPVNHLLAHIYANFIKRSKTDNLKPITFPYIGLIVSGGHTDLLFFESHKKFKWLGGTRDDAAGEAIDKIGRLLDLPYPAGSEIERRANLTLNRKLKFKSPLLHSDDFDFSFSGLKTEVLRFVQKNSSLNESLKNEICYATQRAIIDVLVTKTLKASEKFKCKTILVGGGVSANQTFREQLKLEAKSYPLNPNIYFPEKKYSTDNAAMIGAYALMNPEIKPWNEIIANPELYFE